MSNTEFWTIINATVSDTQNEQSQLLVSKLSKMSKHELLAFEVSYRDALRRAYHWNLWAAAYIINGGCSDDGFDYFCDWLISRGQGVYENALKNPETLVGLATIWDTEYEDFRYIMIDVMTNKHSDEFPKPTTPPSTSPAGEEWDEETVESKYPKLTAWVEETTPTPPPIVPAVPKAIFWQRLFGKR